MRPDSVVVSAPAFDDDLRLLQRVEDFAIKQFVAQACIEAFDVTILPRAARCDEGGFRANGSNPFLHSFSDELGTIVRPNVAGDATQNEEVGQAIDDIDGLQLAADPNHQAFMGKLVDDVQHPVLLPVMGSVFYEVVGPDVIPMLGPKPDARSVIEPQPPALGLLLGNLQPLEQPDPFDPLVIDEPARIPQQRCDLAVAVTAIATGELDDVGGQQFFVFTAPRDLALRRAMLPERRASAALRDMQFISNMLDTGSATRGA